MVSVMVPEAPSVHPVAHTSLLEIATTPVRCGTRPAAGVDTMLHCAPFQRMMSGAEAPASPTAQTSPVPGTADTAVSRLCWLGTFGLGTMDQAEPFQCSTSVFPRPPSLVW